MGGTKIGGVKTEAVARHVLALHCYVTGQLVVPDGLFLRALDVLLEDLPDKGLASQQAAQSLRESKRDR
jgi:hypothetical protein